MRNWPQGVGGGPGLRLRAVGDYSTKQYFHHTGESNGQMENEIERGFFRVL